LKEVKPGLKGETKQLIQIRAAIFLKLQREMMIVVGSTYNLFRLSAEKESNCLSKL
jgi:hypothetical protein